MFERAILFVEETSLAFLHRSKHLATYLSILSQGLQQQHPRLRNAALYLLGQMADHLRPEVTAAAPALLPLLLGALDTGLASLDTSSTPRTVTNTLISLETFCHNLERGLVPHLDMLMTRWVSSQHRTLS